MALATKVPDVVNEVSGLHVHLVTKEPARRILSRLMQDEHPQQAVQHSGRQLRYLLGSDHGWLGGFVFASPAHRLASRDAWIGWDTDGRKAGLQHMLGLSRLLIRPSVRCHNLVSKALKLCWNRLGTDYDDRYHIALYLDIMD